MSQKDYNFQSERLTFTEARWKDIEEIHSLAVDPDVQRYNTLGISENIGVTRKNYRSFIDDHKNSRRALFCWVIRLSENKQFIGVCGLSVAPERFRMGEIFYNLMPASWGKGLGTETARSLILFCFNRLKLHRVYAGVAVNNERSIRVLEKVAMTREAKHRKILPIRGEWVDNFEYAILDEDTADYK